MSDAHKTAEASAENLRRIFTVPEAPDSTLARLEAEIARNLQGFLNERIVATQRNHRPRRGSPSRHFGVYTPLARCRSAPSATSPHRAMCA